MKLKSLVMLLLIGIVTVSGIASGAHIRDSAGMKAYTSSLNTPLGHNAFVAAALASSPHTVVASSRGDIQNLLD